MIAGIEQVAELIRRESGIALAPHRMPALSVAVERVAPGLDGVTVAQVARRDRSASGVLARLIDEVAVNETFFFRHRQELDAIDWRRLSRTAAADGRDRVRVWSAACATGEEPYTLAMLACDAFASHAPPVSILASDISRRVLDRARAGIYNGRSVRLMSAAARAEHLVARGTGYGVRPALAGLVRFRHHNLLSGRFPPPQESLFDLIVCRNVLIYFEPEVAAAVLASLRSALAPGGILLLGSADRLCGNELALTARPSRRDAPQRPATGGAQHAEPSAGRLASSLATAVEAADGGRLADALEVTCAVLAADPLHSEAHYLRGVIELARGDATAAVPALRRALYVEPHSALAAFQLARAHDALSQDASALRAYAQALRILQAGQAVEPGQICATDAVSLEAACRARLHALRSRPAAAPPGGPA